jgi:hypothetical protein
MGVAIAGIGHAASTLSQYPCWHFAVQSSISFALSRRCIVATDFVVTPYDSQISSTVDDHSNIHEASLPQYDSWVPQSVF